MFGCLCPGRPVQTNLQQIDESHAVFTLDNPSTLNHICVFLLGTGSHKNHGYFGFTGLTALQSLFLVVMQPRSILIGLEGDFSYWECKLSNERPSAIFRLRGTFIPADVTSVSHTTFSSISVGPTVLIGIAIEPTEAVLAQCVTLNKSLTTSATISKPMDPTLMAERVAKSLFNYLSSFTTGRGPDSTITQDTIAKWYEYFLSKVKTAGVGFLENE